jgi:hypothetical protein
VRPMDNSPDLGDQLKKAIQDDIDDSEKKLTAIRMWTYAAPHIQSRKSELQSLLDILNVLPPDVVDELAPTLLQIQREARFRFNFGLSPLYTPDPNKTVQYSSSGTSSVYLPSIISLANTDPPPEWAARALASIQHLAQDRARRAELPAKLASIDPGIPATFAAALDSYDKAKSRIVGLDNAVMRMRDLVEHVWRGLTSKARARCPTLAKHLEHKKPTHRQAVADCLTKNAKSAHLRRHLDDLYSLFGELSKPGKDPAFDDSQRTDEFFARLVFQLDSLFVWID